MSDLSTKVHRCCQCHAPLPLERAAQHVARCNFCGTDHRVSSAKANEERQLHQERRLGGIVAPYVLAPLVGFFGYLAYRDFLFAPYEGKPAMIVAVAFLVIGLMGFRMAAVLGLGIMGITGVLKSFVRGIPDWDQGYLSPTSETAFHYLVPGAIALTVAFLFFASLKVRELRPALHALIPRLSVLTIGLVGVVGAYFFVGQSIVEVARQHRSKMKALEDLAIKACQGEAEEELSAKLEPAWISSSNSQVRKNSLRISCGAIQGDTSMNRDPLRIDELAQYKRTIAGRLPRLHQGANDQDRAEYEALARSEYLVVVSSTPDHTGYLISTRSAKVVRKTRVISALTGSSGSQQMLAGLRGETPSQVRPTVAMPSIPLRSEPAKKPPLVPPEASYEHHKTVERGQSTWFYGVVTNTGKIALSKPEVLIIFKNEQGKETGSGHGYSAYALQPGESSPIAMHVADAPDFASTEFELNLRADTSAPEPKRLSISEQIIRQGKNGALEISGKVKNDEERPARFVQVHLSVFDAEGKLSELRSTYVKSDSLPAGSEARFLIQLYGNTINQEDEPRIELAVHGQFDTRESISN